MLSKYRGELTSDDADAILNGISDEKMNELLDRGMGGGLFQRGSDRLFEDIMPLRLTLLKLPCINLLTDLTKLFETFLGRLIHEEFGKYLDLEAEIKSIVVQPWLKRLCLPS